MITSSTRVEHASHHQSARSKPLSQVFATVKPDTNPVQTDFGDGAK